MRVKSVRRITLDTPVPVYDATVDGTENFKLANGPYVHNSKDLSDALAGVIQGLSTRLEVWSAFNVRVFQAYSVRKILDDKPKDRRGLTDTVDG